MGWGYDEWWGSECFVARGGVVGRGRYFLGDVKGEGGREAKVEVTDIRVWNPWEC